MDKEIKPTESHVLTGDTIRRYVFLMASLISNKHLSRKRMDGGQEGGAKDIAREGSLNTM